MVVTSKCNITVQNFINHVVYCANGSSPVKVYGM